MNDFFVLLRAIRINFANLDRLPINDFRVVASRFRFFQKVKDSLPVLEQLSISSVHFSFNRRMIVSDLGVICADRRTLDHLLEILLEKRINLRWIGFKHYLDSEIIGQMERICHFLEKRKRFRACIHEKEIDDFERTCRFMCSLGTATWIDRRFYQLQESNEQLKMGIASQLITIGVIKSMDRYDHIMAVRLETR